jgi:hypothetical protein
MKKILLAFASIIISVTGFSQSCPNFAPGSVITKTAPGLFKLTLNYNGNGQKHLDVAFFEGPVILSNFLSSTCIPTQGSGTVSVNFVSLGNDPRAVVVPGTGNCGGGNSCPTQALTVSYAATGAMPILISTFYAKCHNNLVTLNWQTLSEINAKEFIIQKNTGNGFTDIKTIPAFNKENGASYITTDNNQNKGTTLYRLKMVDFDGTYTNSDTRTVKGTATDADYTIFPNPSSGNGKVSVSDISEPTDVQIIDNTGRVIKNVSMTNNNSIELNNLHSGMYQIRIHTKSQGTVVTKKLTVVN